MKSKSSPLNLCPPTGVTGAKIMGLDWSEIQAMQQKQNVSRALAPVDVDKYRAAVLSDVERFQIPVAVETVNALGIILPESYKLEGDTWRHFSTSPVKDTPAETIREVVIKHDTLKHSYFVSYVTRSKGARYTAGQFDSRFTTLDEVKDWIKINPKLKLVEDAPASPVDSVGVSKFSGPEPYGDLWAIRGLTQTKEEGFYEDYHARIAVCESKEHAELILSALNSHAAKDAKIKALSSSLVNMEWLAQNLLDGLEQYQKTGSKLGLTAAKDHAQEFLAAALAALALPCA